MRALAAMGFNRISFGIQDFDPQVQVAVHRVQSLDSVRDLMLAAREFGFESINADLIYGLPRQTPDSFERTIAQVSELRPDRIALYAYAHLPARFKPQRRIHTAELPSAEARIRMLGAAISGFTGQGYSYIGMDHFALSSDALAAAKRQAGCTATSRATARSPTATCSVWVSRRSAAWAPPTARTRSPCPSITTPCARASSRPCAGWPCRVTTWSAAPSSWR
jgi:coproporphyrinogen III oxidase-like Fe-S oxidoreductase